MPRLVSLTLLSILAWPAAAGVYLLIVIAGDSATSFSEQVLFSIASTICFLTCCTWWWLLWRKDAQIEWQSLVATTIFSVLIGIALGFLSGAMVRNSPGAFAAFVAGLFATVAWQVAMCIVWQKHAKTGSAGKDAAVRCPRCGYLLTGLTSTRCPECGESPTLDELFAAQQPPTIDGR